MNIIEEINNLGGLHDARIITFHWDAKSQRFEVEIDDLYANFYGLEEYKGSTKAVIKFNAVNALTLDLTNEPGQSIYELVLGVNDLGQYKCEFAIAPGGKICVTAMDVVIVVSK